MRVRAVMLPPNSASLRGACADFYVSTAICSTCRRPLWTMNWHWQPTSSRLPASAVARGFNVLKSRGALKSPSGETRFENFPKQAQSGFRQLLVLSALEPCNGGTRYPMANWPMYNGRNALLVGTRVLKHFCTKERLMTTALARP